MSPTLDVALIAAAASATVGLGGVGVVTRWPRRSVRGVLLTAGLIGMLTVVVGVVATAKAMFLSGHDLGIVMTVCGVAGPVGLAVALLLARQVAADVTLLCDSARRMSPAPDGSPVESEVRAVRPTIVELAEVDDELVRSRDRLAEAHRHEQALESSRRELIAWVSHDLRTPLAGLRAMAEALEDGMVDDPRRYHQQIRIESDRLARMVDDLFELSRIQAGALTLSLRRVDVPTLVADVLDGTRPVAASVGVRIGAQVGAASLDADPGGLSRVLANLLVNAIRHTPSDGTVEVAAAQDHRDIVLSVTDRCGGLPEDHLEQVFEPGWRAENARTPQPDGGAGLGLAIARGIVEAHHGQIAVENVDGGCRFVVRLPQLQSA